jgi:hypothetical protein
MISFRYGVLTIHLLGDQLPAGLTAAWRLTTLRAYWGSFLIFLSFFHTFFWGPPGPFLVLIRTLLDSSQALWGLFKENSLFLSSFSFLSFTFLVFITFFGAPLGPSWTPWGPSSALLALLGAPLGPSLGPL